MTVNTWNTARTWSLLLAVTASLAAVGGCHHGCGFFGRGLWRGGVAGAPYDRPFPLGAVTDAHWETQQSNAEAADFVFYDHEFAGETARLAPGAQRHVEEVALRLEHVPYPVVIERSPHDARPQLDRERRRTIVEALARMGLPNVEHRVVIAASFAEGFTAIEGERAYYDSLSGSVQGIGGGFGGSGGRGRVFR